MRRLIALSLLSTLLLAAPASAQLTHIRAGVSAGGVDLSGLTVPEAAAKLDAELGPRLAPDLLIGVAGRPLGPQDGRREAQARLDAHGQARALRQGRRRPPSRRRSATRALAVAAFVASVAKQVGKPRARRADQDHAAPHLPPALEARARPRHRRGGQGDRRRPRRPGRPARPAPGADARAREGQRQRPGPRLQHGHHDRQGALQAAPVQGPEVPQELRRRRRPAGLPDAQRALRHPEQAGQPGLVGAQLAVGRRAAGHDGRRRQRRQPAQGALDGHRQRRRHPRHGRGLLDRHARRRTAASACTWPTSSTSSSASRSGRPCSSSSARSSSARGAARRADRRGKQQPVDVPRPPAGAAGRGAPTPDAITVAEQESARCQAPVPVAIGASAARVRRRDAGSARPPGHSTPASKRGACDDPRRSARAAD